MMAKAFILSAAIVAATMPASAATDRGRAPSWLVAEVAMCELDGRKVPHRTLLCRQGKVWICGARGSWEDTRKAC